MEIEYFELLGAICLFAIRYNLEPTSSENIYPVWLVPFFKICFERLTVCLPNLYFYHHQLPEQDFSAFTSHLPVHQVQSIRSSKLLFSPLRLSMICNCFIQTGKLSSQCSTETFCSIHNYLGRRQLLIQKKTKKNPPKKQQPTNLLRLEMSL